MKKYKILVQRADKLGDIICSLPAIESIKEKYPDSEIHFLTSPIGKDLLENHHQISHILVCQWKNDQLTNESDLLNQIKANRYDFYISLWNHPAMARLGKKATIPVRVGDKSFFFRSFNYTHPVEQYWPDYTRHQIEFNLDLLKPLGIQSELKSATIPVSSSVKKAIKEKLKKSIDSTKKTIFILCSTGGSNHPVPFNYVLQFIKDIQSNGQFNIILGGNSEDDQFKLFKDDSVVNLINSTNMTQLIASISISDYYIGPDSGPTHIASFLNKPILFISTMKQNPPCRWGPLSTSFRIVRKEYNIPVKKITDFDSQRFYGFLEGHTLYNEFLELVYSHSSGTVFSKSKIKSLHLLHSLRVLYIARSNKEYEKVKALESGFYSKGLRVFTYHVDTFSWQNLRQLFYLMNCHNINVIQGDIPSYVVSVLKLYMGVWNQYIKPIYVSTELFPDCSLSDLLEMYQGLFNKKTLYKVDFQ